MLVVSVLLAGWLVAGLVLALIIGPLLARTGHLRETRRRPPADLRTTGDGRPGRPGRPSGGR